MTSVFIYHKATNWIGERAKSKFYVLQLTILLVLMSLFLAAPKYDLWIKDVNATKSYKEVGNLKDNIKYHWDVVMMKSRNLTDPLNQIDQKTHARNTVFRLTIPLIIKIFHLTPVTTYILQFLIGIFLIYLLYQLAFSILGDPVSATFLTTGLAFIYFGRCAFVDVFTQFDGWAYFFLIAAMVVRNPFLIFALSTMAVWADERAGFALSIVFLFHHLDFKESKSITFKNLFRLNFSSFSVIVALLCYFALRYYLSVRYDMHYSMAAVGGLPVFLMRLKGGYVEAGIWTFLEGFWLLVIFYLIYASVKRDYIHLVIIVFPILILVFGACFNDVTRSGSYVVPVLFILLAYLKNQMSEKDMQLLLCICMVICFIFPPIEIAGGFNINSPILMNLDKF